MEGRRHSIQTWYLLIWIALVWLLWAVAATAQVAVVDASDPLPDGKRRRMSAFPVIPLYPLAFWGIARFSDRFVAPWGTVTIGLLHVVFAISFFKGLSRDRQRLKSMTNPKQTLENHDD